jgi:diaminopimelate epimerase
MRFTKMHGLGNDFVVVERDALPAGEPLADLARLVCDRHRGVGADGLLILGPQEADGAWRLEIFNADGSRASSCGNGARCIARYLGAGEHLLRTDAERVRVTWDGRDATVTLRPPRLGRRHLVPLEIGDASVRLVDVGNPHAVVLGVEPESVDLPRVARAVRERLGETNVGVVALAGPDSLRLRVDERGVGETLACGTGACAAVAAARAEGWIGDQAVVRLPGGELRVLLGEDDVVLVGPAEDVFRGELAPE